MIYPGQFPENTTPLDYVKDMTKPIMVKVSDGKPWKAQRDGLSWGDIDIINKLYPPLTSGSFTDGRGGIFKSYKWVKIGTQTWMAENLAYLPVVSANNSSSTTSNNYYVYGYNGINIEIARLLTNYKNYGVLYNFPAAKTACPPGWHLPSYADWEKLAQYISTSLGLNDKVKQTVDGKTIK